MSAYGGGRNSASAIFGGGGSYESEVAFKPGMSYTIERIDFGMAQDGKKQKGQIWIVANILPEGSSNSDEKNQSTHSIISEKPIDLSAKTSIIKSKDTTTVNADFGVKGMKWGKTKEEEPKPEGVKKTKVTKFKTKDGVMTVTSDTKARLGAKGAATIKKGKITEVQVFAGKGGKKPMDLADKFANTYGGKSSDWMHSTGNGKIKLSDGTEKDAEIHWFECEGVGQTKWKIKKFKKG